MSFKRFLLILISSFALVVIADIATGLALRRYTANHRFPGDYEKIDYIARECQADNILVGASLCANDLVTSVFEEALGESVFNCGANGQSIVYYGVVVDALMRRHPPKRVFLTIGHTDIKNFSYGRLPLLNIYYRTDIFTPILDHSLEKASQFGKLGMRSTLLRMNTYWWRLLLYHFISFNEMGQGGYIAKPVRDWHPDEKLDYRPRGSDASAHMPEECLRQLDSIVENCRRNGTELIIIVPPYFGDFGEIPQMLDLREYAHKKGVRLYEDVALKEIADRGELFYDDFHLNDRGAHEYSRLFMQRYLEQTLNGDGR